MKVEIKTRISLMESAIISKEGHVILRIANLNMFIETITTIKAIKEIIKTTKTPFKEIIKTPKTTFKETTKISLKIKDLAHFLHEDIATKDKIATFLMKKEKLETQIKINKEFAGILRIRDSVNLVMGVDFLMVNKEEMEM